MIKIVNEYGASIRVEAVRGERWVFVGFAEDQNDVEDSFAMSLTIDQCAALIAAITDAAKVVAGDGK